MTFENPLCHNLFLHRCTVAFYIINQTADDEWDQVEEKESDGQRGRDDCGRRIEERTNRRGALFIARSFLSVWFG